ncbi:tripartite tricarboxylate transporter TctB family protein [Bradyrhizobium genosp. P]|uniref:tripartite tricarboxylate transporter TctB family protein n=1 Tax=Bradyrhizobium genosp. P TaxID=83641 RepID=UPI003CEE9593
MRQLKAWRDLLGGGLLIAVAIGAVAEGQTYGLGTLTRMGTGFFPVILGVALAALGLAIAIGAFVSVPLPDIAQTAAPSPSWRGIGAIVLGVVTFIVFGKLFGLAPAAFATVFVSALGDRKSSVAGAALLALVLTVFAIAIFSYLLQVQMPVFQLPGNGD